MLGATLVEHEPVVAQHLSLLHALGLGDENQLRAILDARGGELEQPFGLDRAA